MHDPTLSCKLTSNFICPTEDFRLRGRMRNGRHQPGRQAVSLGLMEWAGAGGSRAHVREREREREHCAFELNMAEVEQHNGSVRNGLVV